MKDALKAQLIRQLQDQSRAVEGQQEAELTLSLLDTCSVLLEAAAGCSEQAGAEEFDGLFAAYLGIAGSVDGFAQLVKQRMSPEAAEALRSGTSEQLAAARAYAETTERQLLAAKQELKELCGENIARESRLEANRNTLKKEEERRGRLDQELTEYSDQNIQALREQNQALQAEIDRNRPEAEKLRQAQLALQEQLAALQGRIEAFPEETRALRRRCLESEEALRQLNNAAVLYSPENQAALQAKIEQLGPEVEQLMGRYQDLKTQLERLQADNLTLEEDYPALRAAALEKTEGVLQALEAAVGGRLQEAQRLQHQVDTLRGKLEQCNALRRSYQNWLDADETNLRALMAALGDTESAALRSTLDPAQCERVQNLTASVKGGLEQLEQLLNQALAAYEKDVAQVKERASRRG